MNDFDAFVAFLRTAQAPQVVELLLGLSDAQRKDFGPKLRQVLPGTRTGLSDDHWILAVMATARGARQALAASDAAWSVSREMVPEALRILVDRSPAWLPSFFDGLLRQIHDEWHRNWMWWMVRQAVIDGLIPAPEHPAYYLGTVNGVSRDVPLGRRTVLEHLEQDAGLIGEHLLNMLAAEGIGRRLAIHDDGDNRGWSHALLELAQDGRLDRDRLIDLTLAAPCRDWAAIELPWFVALHNGLQPTLDEVAARQATYVRLLTVPHGPSVAVAQHELGRLLDADRLEAMPVVQASSVTLSRPDKASVMAQLRLLDKIAASHPQLPVADAMSAALEHPRKDVREQAAMLMERHGRVAPVVDQRVEFIAPQPKRRDAPPMVEPIASADELAEVLLALMEQPDALDLERAFDGLLRFAAERPQIADQVITRATHHTYAGGWIRTLPYRMAHVWLTPEAQRPWFHPWRHVSNGLFGVGERWFTHLINAMQGGPARAARRGSLALPTRTDGSIDRDTLNKRLRDQMSLVGSRDLALSELELAIAVLRVAPHERDGLEVTSLLVRATEHPDWQRELATYQAPPYLPAYPDVSRLPPEFLPIFRDLNAPSEVGALRGLLPWPDPAARLHEDFEDLKLSPSVEVMMSSVALLFPHTPDLLAAHAHPFLFRDLKRTHVACSPVIDAIARSRTAAAAPQCSALVLAMAVKDARGRAAAQDALIDLAEHGLLDGVTLGQQAALHLQDGVVVGSRVSKALTQVTTASDATVLPVLEALGEMRPVTAVRKDARAFIELATDLGERTARRPR